MRYALGFQPVSDLPGAWLPSRAKGRPDPDSQESLKHEHLWYSAGPNPTFCVFFVDGYRLREYQEKTGMKIPPAAWGGS